MKIHFDVVNKEKIVHFDRIGIIKSSTSKLFIPKYAIDINQNIVCINQKYYYVKNIYSMFLNELLGSFFANSIGLDSVQYFLGYCNKTESYYLLSELFYEKDYQYGYISDFYSEYYQSDYFDQFLSNIFQFNDHFFDIYCNENLKDTFFKLVAIDLFMHQTDRHMQNLQLKEKDGQVNFTRIYDYGATYSPYSPFENFNYTNPLIIVKRNMEGYKSLFYKIPEIYDYLKKLCLLDMKNVIRQIERHNGIAFQKNIKKYYIDKQKKYISHLQVL